MKHNDLVGLIWNIVAKVRGLEPAETPDEGLLAAFDSIELVEVIVMLELELSVALPDEVLTDEIFESVSSLASAVGPLLVSG